MKDTVAIFGDVHGESSLLKELVKRIKAENESMEIYSTGDLIDRGPDSKGVIDICIENNVKAVCGNHELWMRMAFTDDYFDPFALEEIMGGTKTLKSYGIQSSNLHNIQVGLKNIPQSHKDFFINLPKFIRFTVGTDNYLLLHSAITNTSFEALKSLCGKRKQEDVFMFLDKISHQMASGYIMWPSPKLPNKYLKTDNVNKFKNITQVFGHKPISEAIISDKFIALDTGCGTCNPFTLSAVLLPSKRIIKVTKADLNAI